MRHPDPDKLLRFVRNELSDQERKQILTLANQDKDLMQKIAEIKKHENTSGEVPEISSRLKDSTLQALNLDKHSWKVRWQKIQIFLWPVLFVFFMVLSFVVRAYFIQMIVLAVVAALQWLLSIRARHVNIRVTHEESRKRIHHDD